MARKLNQRAIVIEMSITGQAGIAIAFGRRIRREIRKIASKRSPDTDYPEFLGNINDGISTGVIRHSGAQADAAQNERGRERIPKGK